MDNNYQYLYSHNLLIERQFCKIEEEKYKYLNIIFRSDDRRSVKLKVTTRNVVFLIAYFCITRSAFYSIEHCQDQLRLTQPVYVYIETVVFLIAYFCITRSAFYSIRPRHIHAV